MTLTVTGLSAGYGNKLVVEDVGFAVGPGEILALLGHNGAGKTTTLKAVMGLLPARAGNVRFEGAAMDRLSVNQRVGRGLRLLPEGRGVFPDLSVGENVAVVAARAVRGPDALFGMADVFRLFPALDERRAARAGSLSGGQQQMLALGLAILGTPRCLLLDEPSIGLAPNLVERIFAQISELCRSHGMAAILVEQKRGGVHAHRRPGRHHEHGTRGVRRHPGAGARGQRVGLLLTGLPQPSCGSVRCMDGRSATRAYQAARRGRPSRHRSPSKRKSR